VHQTVNALTRESSTDDRVFRTYELQQASSLLGRLRNVLIRRCLQESSGRFARCRDSSRATLIVFIWMSVSISSPSLPRVVV
jgi:hypothetical protein